jgi:carbamoyl-phosphate synthase small subunit
MAAKGASAFRDRHPRADPPHPLSGAPNAVIAHDPEGTFDLPALLEKAQAWGGLEGLDLAIVVTRTAMRSGKVRSGIWARAMAVPPAIRARMSWRWISAPRTTFSAISSPPAPCDGGSGADPPKRSWRSSLPVFLSNGPGDPAATAPMPCR